MDDTKNNTEVDRNVNVLRTFRGMFGSAANHYSENEDEVALFADVYLAFSVFASHVEKRKPRSPCMIALGRAAQAVAEYRQQELGNPTVTPATAYSAPSASDTLPVTDAVSTTQALIPSDAQDALERASKRKKVHGVENLL